MMQVGIVGGQARMLARKAGNGTRAAAPRRIGARYWDVLALTRAGAAELCGRRRGVPCGTLLVPGDGTLPPALRAAQIVSYGFSPRDTLTLSSVGGLICVQRQLLSIYGALIEPQELSADEAWRGLPVEHALLLAGLRLLTRPREE